MKKTGNFEKHTKQILNTLVSDKERELEEYKLKVSQLEVIMSQNPDSALIEYKYVLAKARCEQLERTIYNLYGLEQEIQYNRFRQVSTLKAS